MSRSRKEEIIQKELIQDKIKKASLCHGWQRQQEFVDFNKGKDLKEDELRQFIIQYFKEGCSTPINLEGYCCPQFTPDLDTPDLKIKTNIIVLYGADFMPTRKVIKYFSYFNPLEIKWLNDSTCTISFETETAAKRAIYENAENFDDKRRYQGLLEQSFKDLPIKQQLQWFNLVPYYEMAFERKLFARMATNMEKSNFIEQQALILQYEPLRVMFFELYAKKYEKNCQEQWRKRQQRRKNWQDRSQQNKNHTRRERPCYARHPRELYQTRKGKQLDMSKFNYSFARNPKIKEEVDDEQPDQDLSMMSFQKRFDNMSINDSNLSRLSFKKHNTSLLQEDLTEKMLNMDLDKSFPRLNLNDEPRIKNENLNMSFKKWPVEVIQINDD